MIIQNNTAGIMDISPERRRVLQEIATVPPSYVGKLLKAANILDVQGRVNELITTYPDFETFANHIEQLPPPISELDIYVLIKKDHPKKVTDKYRGAFLEWIGGCLQENNHTKKPLINKDNPLKVSAEESLTLEGAKKLQEAIQSCLGELGIEIRQYVKQNNNGEKNEEEFSPDFTTLDTIGHFLNNFYVEYPPKKSLKIADDADGFEGSMLDEEESDDIGKTGNGEVDTLLDEKEEEAEVHFYHIQTLMFTLDWVYTYIESISYLINVQGVDVKKVFKQHEQCLEHLQNIVVPDLKKLYIYITEYTPYQSIANYDTFSTSSLTIIFSAWEQLNIVRQYYKEGGKI